MIAVDWGSSSLRAYRLGARADIIEQHRAPLGALACEDRFEEVLQRQIVGWDDALAVAGAHALAEHRGLLQPCAVCY